MGMCWHPNPTRNINSVNSKKSWRVYETRAHCHCYRGIGNYSWTSLDFLSCWPAVLSDSSCEAQPCVLPACPQSLRLQLPSVQLVEIGLIMNSTWVFPVRSGWAMEPMVWKGALKLCVNVLLDDTGRLGRGGLWVSSVGHKDKHGGMEFAQSKDE